MHGLQCAFGRGDLTLTCGVQRNGSANGASEGLEDRFELVMGVDAFQVIDMQGGPRVVDESLEKLEAELRIEASDLCTREMRIHVKAGAAGKVDDHA